MGIAYRLDFILLFYLRNMMTPLKMASLYISYSYIFDGAQCLPSTLDIQGETPIFPLIYKDCRVLTSICYFISCKGQRYDLLKEPCLLDIVTIGFEFESQS